MVYVELGNVDACDCWLWAAYVGFARGELCLGLLLLWHKKREKKGTDNGVYREL